MNFRKVALYFMCVFLVSCASTKPIGSNDSDKHTNPSNISEKQDNDYCNAYASSYVSLSKNRNSFTGQQAMKMVKDSYEKDKNSEDYDAKKSSIIHKQLIRVTNDVWNDLADNYTGSNLNNKAYELCKFLYNKT